MSSAQYVFTVFTPTFNRADLLERVFRSLARQTFRDFEWLVIDDGSTDHTQERVMALAAEADFPVRYLRQEHRHKKAAFNHGVRQARGSLLVALDDDDEIPADTLENLDRVWRGIPAGRRENYIGATGLCARPDGKIVGDLFPKDVFDCTAADMYFKHRVRGEKFGCQRVDVLRRFPYPEDIEGFVPESLVWWAIAREGYLNRFVNQIVRTYHPTPGSLSRNKAAVQRDAGGLYLLSWDTLQHHLGAFFYKPGEFFMAAARFTRFSLTLRRDGARAALLSRYRLTHPLAWLLVGGMWPLGWAMHKLDARRAAAPVAA
jgi:glycosyltransferase involved in cell wall biosynthesis